MSRRLPLEYKEEATMSPFFEGLYFHEVVLLVLGVLLFVMLVIGFFYQLVHKRSMAPLLPFFSIPIAMIGFSSVKSIQYKDGLIAIDKTTQQLQENPTDTSLRQTLQQQVAKIAARPSSNPQSTVLVAKAQYALGDEEAAKNNLQKALQASPTDPAAHELQRKIAVVDSLKQLASQVEADPANDAAKARLASTLAQTSELKLASPVAVVQVARAQTALGEHTKALENTQKVLAIAPNSPTALQLQNTIKSRITAPPSQNR
jgi:tetratricopeptide (TPR) repeat protein